MRMKLDFEIPSWPRNSKELKRNDKKNVNRNMNYVNCQLTMVIIITETNSTVQHAIVQTSIHP